MWFILRFLCPKCYWWESLRLYKIEVNRLVEWMELQILATPLISCMTLDKLLRASVSLMPIEDEELGTQLCWYSACLAYTKHWIWSPAPHKPGMEAYVIQHSGGGDGRMEVWGHPWLHSLRSAWDTGDLCQKKGVWYNILHNISLFLEGICV